MRRFIVSTATALMLAAGSLASASTWEIDPAHTGAQFAVRHLMVSTVRGNLGKVTGVVNIDETDLTRSSVEASIDATAIDTREPKRDEHLRSPDFFDIAKYPTITFKSKKVTQIAVDKFQVTGDLTTRGVTKEVILDVEGSPKPFNDPFGKARMGGVARAKINRQDFAVSWSKTLDSGGLVVGNDIDITIDIELTKK